MEEFFQNQEKHPKSDDISQLFLPEYAKISNTKNLKVGTIIHQLTQ
jgi:hypothetical protein